MGRTRHRFGLAPPERADPKKREPAQELGEVERQDEHNGGERKGQSVAGVFQRGRICERRDQGEGARHEKQVEEIDLKALLAQNVHEV